MATTNLSKEFINEQYNCLNGIYKPHSLMGYQVENLMVDAEEKVDSLRVAK